MSRTFWLLMEWFERSLDLGRKLSFRIQQFSEIHDTSTSREGKEGLWATSLAFKEDLGCGISPVPTEECTMIQQMWCRLRLPPGKVSRDVMKCEDLWDSWIVHLERNQGPKADEIKISLEKHARCASTIFPVNIKLDVINPVKEGGIQSQEVIKFYKNSQRFLSKSGSRKSLVIWGGKGISLTIRKTQQREQKWIKINWHILLKWNRYFN